MVIDIQYSFLPKVFLELINNREFKTQFQANCPEIYADIESAYNNPNCSCRAKIEAYINKNREKVYPFLKLFLESNKIDLDLASIEQKYKMTPYVGKTEVIKISEWSSYVENLTKIKAAFRNFSVIKEDEEHIRIFFL